MIITVHITSFSRIIDKIVKLKYQSNYKKVYPLIMYPVNFVESKMGKTPVKCYVIYP